MYYDLIKITRSSKSLPKSLPKNLLEESTPKAKTLIIKNRIFMLYIKSSLRGFHIHISTITGTVLKVFTLGKLGFKKALRYNRFSLVALVKEIFKEFEILRTIARKRKQKIKLHIILKNFNFKRQRLVRRFFKKFLRKAILSVVDLSDFPYNGCRPKQAKRK